jgi:hypothetical protein
MEIAFIPCRRGRRICGCLGKEIAPELTAARIPFAVIAILRSVAQIQQRRQRDDADVMPPGRITLVGLI